MADIEARVAEIFRERVVSPMRVITIEVVRPPWPRWGPLRFRRDPPPGSGERRRANGKRPGHRTCPEKLYRSRTNRSIAGIWGGLGDLRCGPHDDPAVMLLLILFGGLSICLHHPLVRHPLKNRPGNSTRSGKKF